MNEQMTARVGFFLILFCFIIVTGLLIWPVVFAYIVMGLFMTVVVGFGIGMLVVSFIIGWRE